MACNLNCICMEKNVLFSAYLSYFSYRLDSSDLVVCEHYRYEACIFADRICDLFRCYDSIIVNIKKSDLKTLLLKLIQSMKNCVVLESR